MKVYNKGVVHDKDTGKEYTLSGVEYDQGFKGGNGLVFVLAEDEKYAAIQEVKSFPAVEDPFQLEKIVVSTVATLKNYSFKKD